MNAGAWRTTTFRLATLYGLAYAVGMVLLLGLVYLAVANALTRRSDVVTRAELTSWSGADRRACSSGRRARPPATR